MVMRDDALNGTHWDVYAYDPVSGRLASVQDALTGEVNSFVWNPEGTLARWEQPSSHARVFGYDEEGRLTKIERDYGSGGVQLAYEYGYNSDGACVEAGCAERAGVSVCVSYWMWRCADAGV
jgi:YD repeat-containing protein